MWDEPAAPRIWNIIAALRDAGLIAMGDKGYHGHAHQHLITPYKGRDDRRLHETCGYRPPTEFGTLYELGDLAGLVA